MPCRFECRELMKTLFQSSKSGKKRGLSFNQAKKLQIRADVKKLSRLFCHTLVFG